MPRASAQRTAARREEIVDACAKLYETMSFKEVTIKEIGAATSFTRTSIYNYFQTKEEIFLALFQREYEAWARDLEAICTGHDVLAAPELAEELARSIERRMTLLRLLSMNLYDMEENSRLDRLVELKTAYGSAVSAVERCIAQFCPDMDRAAFLSAFFPFMYGIYPYTVLTPKQREAMKRAGVIYQEQSVYEFALAGIRRLLGETSNEQRRTQE